jgi:hypothetical protein
MPYLWPTTLELHRHASLAGTTENGELKQGKKEGEMKSGFREESFSNFTEVS